MSSTPGAQILGTPSAQISAVPGGQISANQMRVTGECERASEARANDVNIL